MRERSNVYRRLRLVFFLGVTLLLVPSGVSAEESEGGFRVREYLRIGPLTGGGASEYLGVGAHIQSFQMCWKHFFITALDVGLVGFEDLQHDSSYVFFAVTVLGYPLDLDDAKRHELRFGLGTGYMRIMQDTFHYKHGFSGFYFAPRIGYTFALTSHLGLGLDIMILLPAVGIENIGYIEGGTPYDWALLGSVGLTWLISPRIQE